MLRTVWGKQRSGTQEYKALEPKRELVILRLPWSPGRDLKAPAKSGVGTMNSTVMMTGSKPILNWGPDPQGPAPKSCWDAPSPSPPNLTQAVAKIPRAKRLGPSRFQSPCRSSCRAIDSSIAPSKYSTWRKRTPGAGLGWQEAPVNAPRERLGVNFK